MKLTPHALGAPLHLAARVLPLWVCDRALGLPHRRDSRADSRRSVELHGRDRGGGSPLHPRLLDPTRRLAAAALECGRRRRGRLQQRRVRRSLRDPRRRRPEPALPEPRRRHLRGGRGSRRRRAHPQGDERDLRRLRRRRAARPAGARRRERGRFDRGAGPLPQLGQRHLREPHRDFGDHLGSRQRLRELRRLRPRWRSRSLRHPLGQRHPTGADPAPVAQQRQRDLHRREPRGRSLGSLHRSWNQPGHRPELHAELRRHRQRRLRHPRLCRLGDEPGLPEQPERHVHEGHQRRDQRRTQGAAIGDYDGDGNLDWFVSSIWDRTRTRWGTPGT